MTGVNLDTAEEALRAFVKGVVDDLKATLGDRLTAVIPHGSLATGSFCKPKSDVDLLVVVNDIAESHARETYRLFRHCHSRRPYVTTNGLQPLRGRELPTDGDLIAHLTAAKYRGLSLFGRPPADLIGDLPWADYLASVRGDIDWILGGDNVLASP